MPTKILVATDGSTSSHLAARMAVELAHAFGSELHVVHVFPVFEPYYTAGKPFTEGSTVYEEEVQWARELLAGQVKQIEEQPGGKVTKAYLRTGKPDAEVIELGEEIGADLIVVGSRGLSTLRPPIGSVSSSIVAHAHCAVLVVRGE